jgi:uncharacterized membrane protein/nitrite reductase/ring-hydroxylating ferredoxin subunit
MRSKAAVGSHPIHPMLVAFPIGLFITSLAFDVIGVELGYSMLTAAGWYCAVAGLCGGLLAAAPGTIDLFSVVPKDSSARTRGYKHALLNLLVIGLFIAEVVYRQGPTGAPDLVSLCLSGAAVFVLLFSGWMGATLVYRNQIGVDHRYANAGKWQTRELSRWDQPVCKESELKEGQLILVNLSGTRIVLGRCPEGLVAFSDRCTHKGGPLSDGALVGCTVQCPWHGSQFNVHDGRVVNGPAEHRIEAFDAVAENGNVFVRPRHGAGQERVA